MLNGNVDRLATAIERAAAGLALAWVVVALLDSLPVVVLQWRQIQRRLQGEQEAP